MILDGRCHCSNLRIEFETALEPTTLPLRACQCFFCRSHGAVSTSDPDGGLNVGVRECDLVSPYRFGLGITDFLICRRCGVYVLALAEMDGAHYAVLNVNALERRIEMAGPIQPMDYDAESVDTRRARRKARWTPVRRFTGF